MKTTRHILATPFRATSPALFGLGLLCISLLIASIAYFTARESKHHLYERASISTHNAVNLLDLAISSAINKISTTLDHLASDWQESLVLNSPELLQQELKQHTTNPELTELAELGLTNTEGLLIFSKIAPSLANGLNKPVPLLNPQPINSSLQLDGPFLNEKQEWVMRLTRTLNDAQGVFSGTVYAHIPLRHIQDILNEARLGPHGAATVRTTSLALIARNPTPPSSELGGNKTSVQLKEAIKQNPSSGEFLATTAVDNIERINVYRRLQNYPLYILAGLAINDLAPEQSPVKSPVFILATLAICLVLLGGAWIYRSNQRLSEQESLFRRFFEQNGLVMLILDSNSGKILAANQEATVFYGQPREKLEQMHINDLNDKQQKNLILKTYELDQPQVISLKHQCKTDEVRDVEVYCSPVSFRGHKNVFLIVHDVTAHQKTLLNLRESTKAAQAASRAKSAFVANMSHEIRTPMNAVIGLLELMHYTPLNENQSDYVNKAETAAKTLLSILNDILDFSKVEEDKLNLESTQFSFDELLLNLSIISASATQNKSIEIVFDIDPKIPEQLTGDRLRLQQVLLNLIGNAIKFTEAGEIYVQAQLINRTAEKVQIEWRVCDTGIGIPEDRLTTIFEGFTQAEESTTRRYGGTGLGLAISRRLVTLMGGELSVESTPDQGSCFWFSLELQYNSEPSIFEPKISDPKDLKVLLIEGHTSTRVVLERLISISGWTTLPAQSAQQALSIAQQSKAPLDVILLDWTLADMEPQALIQQLRQLPATQTAHWVLMTNAQQQSEINQHPSISQLYDETITKPIIPSRLMRAIQRQNNPTETTSKHPTDTQQPLFGLSLLLAEDNRLNQQVAKTLLSHAGAKVILANNGQEAVQLIQQHNNTEFDAVLMDIQMPEMDGYEATRHIRAHGFTQPIIAMTANALTSDREACLAAGMNDHIGKPIDLNNLISTLLKHCPKGQTTQAITENVSAADQAEPVVNLTGFDIPTALNRLGNDKTLFFSLVQDFALEQPQLIQNAKVALINNHQYQALQELHTLKGLLASLGSNRLTQLVKDLESDIKANRLKEPEALERLKTLEPQLESGLHELLVLANQIKPEERTTAELSTQELNSELLELYALIREHNMRAITVYNQLPTEIDLLSKEEQAALNTAMHQLDFKAAHRILQPRCEAL